MSQQVLERPTNTPEDTATPAKVFPPLKAEDRCDAATVAWEFGTKKLTRCGAQAFVRAVMPSGLDLLFCGHCIGELAAGVNPSTKRTSAYYASQRAELLRQGATIYSEYDKINLKPSESSEAKGS